MSEEREKLMGSKAGIRRRSAIITSLLLLLIFAFGLSSYGASTEESGRTSDDSESKVNTSADAYYERLLGCMEQIEKITDFKPEVVIVLGSGLQEYADKLDVVETISYSDIEGWPISTAPGHVGKLVFAKYKDLNIAIMQGRVHYYEGYSMPEVVLPLRVLHLLGAQTCILTNAVGAINAEYHVGDFICIRDQISSFVPSPLIGENIDELGERFVGMTDAYDKDMRETVLRIGSENGIPIHSGVYLQVTGPQYETPAEIAMYRNLGADTVGMSIAVETIAARHMGMKVCGINCVSNMAAGMEEGGFSHESVTEAVGRSADNLEILLKGLLDSLAN